MKTARAAAVLTWIYVAAFGVPAIPVAAYLLDRGNLPTFMGLFEVYGGPWSARLEPRTFVAILAAFFAVTMLAAWSARWRGEAGDPAPFSTSPCCQSRRSSGLASRCHFPGSSASPVPACSPPRGCLSVGVRAPNRDRRDPDAGRGGVIWHEKGTQAARPTCRPTTTAAAPREIPAPPR